MFASKAQPVQRCRGAALTLAINHAVPVRRARSGAIKFEYLKLII